MNENSTKKKSFVGGAMLLGVAGATVKLLGAIFRIPLANMIGDSGMGYYQTAYPIYIGLLSIATTGIPTAISRLIAERRAKGMFRASFRVYRLSLYLMAGLGLLTGVTMFIFAPAICNFIKEPNAVWCMYSVAPALIVCPIISSIRGYYQGEQNMIPTAISQVVEQVFRVSSGFILVVVLLKKGLEFAAAGATSGAAIGGTVALLYIAITFSKRKKKIFSEFEPENNFPVESAGKVYREILQIAIPITLGAMIMPTINSIDTIIVKSRLLDIGYTSDAARALYGQLSGMASPIINMPDAITSAVCMSLVPIIADAKLRGDKPFVRKNARLSLRYACIVGLPCSIGICALAKPIMLLVYPLQAEAATSAAVCLAAYAPGVVLLAIHQACSGVLQGIGKQIIPVRNLFIGAVIKVIATYILCGIPSINVVGAAYGTVITYAISATLSLISVKKHTRVKFHFAKSVGRPLISSIIMGISAILSYKLLSSHFGNGIATLLAIVIAVVVYVISILLTHSITPDELRGIKGMGRLADLLDKIAPKRA